MTVTATRMEQPIAAVTSSISVVSSEALQQVSHIHINEALSRVPGVWVSRGNGQEHLTAIRSPVLTGAGSCGAFYIAEDGIPVRATGLCNVNQLFDINTEQAQRIEVLRGPGTGLHGSDALHGVINVISLAPSSDTENLLSLEGGSNDYGRIKASHSDSNGAHGYRISVNGAHDGGYKDDSGFDQQKLSARHDYNSDDISLRTLLSLSNLNQETAGYVSDTDAYKDDSRKRDNPDAAAFRNSESARLQSRFEKRLANGGTFIATPYARYADMAFLMHFLPGDPLEENNQRGVGVQTAYSRPISDQLTFTNGFDAEYSDASLKQTQAQEGGPPSIPVGKQYDYDVTVAMMAAFLTADYTLSPATTLSAGARYEFLDYEYDNRMISGNTAEDGSICGASGCRYSRPDDRGDDFGNWSVNAGMVHTLSDELSAIIRLAHGFRAPQATELYRLQAGQLEAQLDSEEINSIELGLRGAVGDVSYSFTSFYMKKTNVIFQDSDRLRVDDGQTRHYGLEYALGWQFTDSWNLNLAGSFARQQYTTDVSLFGSEDSINIDRNDIDTAPHYMGSAQLGWQPGQNTRAELEWVYMGKYYTDIDNLHSYEGHDLLHLRLRQQITSDISVGLRINNLTDTDYAERADFSSFSGDRYFIGEPRSYYADISFSF